ncbi:class I SAM-dependent methyltransferase [Brevundimonas sp.]|uniref:class I SAM-dependent methyltransferase n=1 Tax=Brevundimonas sp. TaxID=1871086 RepID=UPI002FCC49FE
MFLMLSAEDTDLNATPKTTDKGVGWFVGITDFSPEDYDWREGRLIARDAMAPFDATSKGGLGGFVVKHIYADHNSTAAVRRALAPLLAEFARDESRRGLNFGSGGMQFHKRFINLDVQNTKSVDIVSNGGRIPLADASIDLIITQEVLEHVADYRAALGELERVLRPGGEIYCQLPFQIGFHPGPYDFRRFSRHGVVDLFAGPQWSIRQVGISVGHGTALYRIMVEFFAVTASALHQVLYKPMKGAASILLWPLKLFDGLTERSAERDRIAGGYFVVATRTEAPSSGR